MRPRDLRTAGFEGRSVQIGRRFSKFCWPWPSPKFECFNWSQSSLRFGTFRQSWSGPKFEIISGPGPIRSEISIFSYSGTIQENLRIFEPARTRTREFCKSRTGPLAVLGSLVQICSQNFIQSVLGGFLMMSVPLTQWIVNGRSTDGHGTVVN